MRLNKILIAILFQLAVLPLLASPICRHFYAGTYRVKDAIVSWYMPIDFGYHFIELGLARGQVVVNSVTPQANMYPDFQMHGPPREINFKRMRLAAKMMPGLDEKTRSHYFAVETRVPEHYLPHMAQLVDIKTMERFRQGKSVKVGKLAKFNEVQNNQLVSKYMLELHDAGNLKEIEDLVNYDLTWRTYLAEGTVGPKDVDSFKETERELDPRRKITFEVWVPEIVNGKMTKKSLSIMRVYDGSLFPSNSFSDYPTHTDPIDTDPRVPVERRYPEINFRKDTDNIFEPGRLAKSPEMEDSMIEFQFMSLAQYLQKKFGFAGLAPESYVKKGKVLAEITGRNLEKFMKLRAEGGFGYTLDYIVQKTPAGRKITKVKRGTKYEDLAHHFTETDTKFLLHHRVGTFVRDFY